MHQALKFTPVIAALLLAACGGGGSDTTEPITPPPPPPPQETTKVELIAGAATSVNYDLTDKEPGCADGAAIGAKLSPKTPAFARTANGNLLLAEWGYCDARYHIRVIDPAANSIKTVAAGAEWNVEEALTTFLKPIAIAVAPSGDIYIGDSEIQPTISYGGMDFPDQRTIPDRGPGIWKLGVDGSIRVVAGVSLPRPIGKPAVDGVGAEASFRYIGQMCYGSDGLIYLNDYYMRTVSPDGTVTTFTNPDYALRVVACGIDGSVLARRWFSDPTKDDFYDPIAQKSIAKVQPSLLYVSSSNPLLYFGPANPAALLHPSGYNGLPVVNFADGNYTPPVAKFSTAETPVDLTATPPVIDAELAAVATGGMNFDLLTNQGVLRFTRKP